MDWTTNWRFYSDNYALYYNKLHKLGKTGLSSTFSLAQDSHLLCLVAKKLEEGKGKKI